ncbi:MAG: amidohydrolase family protein, partial [Planctomycetota bacterium]
MVFGRRWLLTLCVMAVAGCLGGTTHGQDRTRVSRAVEGLHQNKPSVHALVGGRIVTEPGGAIEEGVLLIRDGVIEAVGSRVEVPADARVWDVSGKVLYPGLIDAYSEVEVDDSELSNGAPYWNPAVRPQLEVGRLYKADNGLNKKYRGQGVVARLAAPSSGIIKGAGAVVSTGDGNGERGVLRSNVTVHVRFRPMGDYPKSSMGAIALTRQALYDTDWYDKAWDAYKLDPSVGRPEKNDALESLLVHRDARTPAVFDASNKLYAMRASRVASEFGIEAIIRGAGDAYQRLDAIKAMGRAIIVPLNFPEAPDVSSPGAAREVTLETLMHWDTAPENAARLAKAGVEIALTGHGLGDGYDLLKAVRQAVRRGLSKDDALRALTLMPAELFGVDASHGRLREGMAANVVVADGDLFEDDTKVMATWVDGVRYEVAAEPKADLKGEW